MGRFQGQAVVDPQRRSLRRRRNRFYRFCFCVGFCSCACVVRKRFTHIKPFTNHGARLYYCSAVHYRTPRGMTFFFCDDDAPISLSKARGNHSRRGLMLVQRIRLPKKVTIVTNLILPTHLSHHPSSIIHHRSDSHPNARRRSIGPPSAQLPSIAPTSNTKKRTKRPTFIFLSAILEITGP